MSKLYYYWQQTGGTDPWNPVHADSSLSDLKPTFVTVLAIDTLLEDSPSREQIDACKYLGPMYFDLDAPDIADSIEGGQALLTKLKENGLKDSDIEIFLSGKKGLHFLIPMSVFCEKAVPTVKLPAIYKEMAFKLAVDTVDFRVYTARKGRMLRTCHNIRENGNYRVPITASELETLTPESYEALCKAPRYVPPATPTYNPKFSLVFEAAQQKIASIKKKKAKVVDSNELKKQLPAVQQMLRGEALADVGFNKIAIQLAIFARESNWSEDQLVENAQGLCNNHQSDGRYNTPRRREAELRRMHSYIAENAAYEYDPGILRSCLRRETIELNTEYDEEGGPLSMDLTNGIVKRPGNYVVLRSEDELIISNFALKPPKFLKSMETQELVAMLCTTTCGKEFTADSKDFTSSSALQNKVSKYFLSFTGTDIHARSIYAIMIKEAKEESYLIDSEGLNLVKIPRHPVPEVAEGPFLAWASRDGVSLPKHIAEHEVNLTFQGFPDERGLFQTDLTKAPSLQQWLRDDPENTARLNKFVKQMFACANRGTVAKILGWMVAAHYKPLFHAGFEKFPLLHVYGLAGLGKCLGVDTPVMMFDGTVKKVQEVQVGDKLLGPDGGVRNVLSLARGRETMYRVIPVKGDSYVVNESHILSLKKSDINRLFLADGTIVEGDADVVNVNVKTIHETDPKHSVKLKGWKPDGLEFPTEKSDLPVDPYWLGAWLGDGNSHDVAIYKPACNMTEWLHTYADSLDCRVSVYDADGCPGWAIVGKERKDENPIRVFLQSYGLLANKHIPHDFLTASRENRLKLLAGLVDTDGSISDGNIDFITVNKLLAEQLVFLCRSLGLAAYRKDSVKGIKSTGFVGNYHRVTISGDCSVIPTLDKRAAPRKQVKRVTVTGIKTEKLEVDDYYGFTLDGDHLFLLGDFTVTHNTEFTSAFLKLHYYRQEPASTTPSSTPYSFLSFVGGSGSIPILMDEWKPGSLNRELAEKYRSIFRDAYNAKETSRGGGTRTNDRFNALNRVPLSAPITYIAEAAETETAIVERSVMVPFRRSGDIAQNAASMVYAEWSQDKDILSVLGREIAAGIMRGVDLESFKSDFGKMHKWAVNKYRLVPGDDEKLQSGELSQAEYTAKATAKDRPVFNNTVALFGLVVLRKLLSNVLGDALDPEVIEEFKAAGSEVFRSSGSESSLYVSEYIKVLSIMSDMSRTTSGTGTKWLEEGIDFNLSEIEGKTTLVLASRFAYNKYRQFCRSMGTIPMYPGENAFELALREVPSYITSGAGTKTIDVTTAVFDSDALLRAGVPIFAGKPVVLNR